LLKNCPRLSNSLEHKEKGHEGKSKVDSPRLLLLKQILRRRGKNKYCIGKKENVALKRRKQTRSEEPRGYMT